MPLCQVARRRCRCAPATLHPRFSHAHRTDHAPKPRTHLQRVLRAITEDEAAGAAGRASPAGSTASEANWTGAGVVIVRKQR